SAEQTGREASTHCSALRSDTVERSASSGRVGSRSNAKNAGARRERSAQASAGSSSGGASSPWPPHKSATSGLPREERHCASEQAASAQASAAAMERFPPTKKPYRPA